MSDVNKIRRRMKQRRRYYQPKQERVLNDYHFNRIYHKMIKTMSVMVIGLALMTYIKANPKDLYVREFVLNDTLLTNLSPFIHEQILSLFNEEESSPVATLVSYEWIEGNYYKNDTNQVQALDGGIVRFKGNQAILGNYIIVVQDNGVKVIYACLNDIQVDLYDRIEKGTPLASYQDSLMMIFEKDEQEITYEQALSLD